MKEIRTSENRIQDHLLARRRHLDEVAFDYATLQYRLREMAFCSGLKIRLRDERRTEAKGRITMKADSGSSGIKTKRRAHS